MVPGERGDGTATVITSSNRRTRPHRPSRIRAALMSAFAALLIAQIVRLCAFVTDIGVSRWRANSSPVITWDEMLALVVSADS